MTWVVEFCWPGSIESWFLLKIISKRQIIFFLFFTDLHMGHQKVSKSKFQFSIKPILLFFVFKASKLQSSPSSDYFFCLLRIFVFVTDLCPHLVFFVHSSLFHVCQVVTFTKRIKMAVLFWIFLDQICPKWIKLDQIGCLTNQKMLL